MKVCKGCQTSRSFSGISAKALLNNLTKNKCTQTPEDVAY